MNLEQALVEAYIAGINYGYGGPRRESHQAAAARWVRHRDITTPPKNWDDLPLLQCTKEQSKIFQDLWVSGDDTGTIYSHDGLSWFKLLIKDEDMQQMSETETLESDI